MVWTATASALPLVFSRLEHVLRLGLILVFMLLVGRAEGLERQEDFCLTILRTIQEGSIGCFKAKLLVHHPRKIVRALVSERGKRDKGQPCGPTIDFARHRWRCEAAMAVHHTRYFFVNFFGLLEGKIAVIILRDECHEAEH